MFPIFRIGGLFSRVFYPLHVFPRLGPIAYFTSLNSLSPYSDQHQISPCNINAYSIPEVMRIKDVITQGIFSWYFNTFSPVLL